MNNFAEPATTTTTRTTVTETKVNLAIRWDPSYIKEIPGMLKIAAVVSQVSFLSNVKWLENLKDFSSY